jgi:parallel beta-helix repeat protein
MAATLPTIGAATAQVTVACGQTITQNTTLAADVGPCANNGIIVGADNITLDLAGHRIFGTPNYFDKAGVLLQGRTGVTVKNGTVEFFDGGVVIQGGGSNTVDSIAARRNIGISTQQDGSTLYGDGFAVESSSDNKILNSQAIDNGPFSGIGVYSLVDSDHPRTFTGPSQRNLIDHNQVLNNVVGRDGFTGSTDNDGIRIEAPFTCPANNTECSGPASANVITNNEVTGNGLDGISLFSRSSGNVIRYNQVTRNGYFRSAARRGDGIIAFNRGNGNVIENNIVAYNADNGIRLRGVLGANPGSLNNRVVGNTAYGNAAFPTIPSAAFGNAAFDLQDQNVNCDNNVWSANRYHTASPECTKAGGQQI